MSFFALSFPENGSVGNTDNGEESKPGDRVFRSLGEALKVLKSHKNARLKTFATQEEAEQFASVPIEALKPQNSVGYFDLFNFVIIAFAHAPNKLNFAVGHDSDRWVPVDYSRYPTPFN
jgi:hypothetical protein